MKNSEWLFLASGLIGLASIFLKIPWWFLNFNNYGKSVSEELSVSRLAKLFKKLNSAGTFALALLVVIFSFAVSWMIMEKRQAELSAQPAMFLRLILLTGFWTLVFSMFCLALYIAKQSLKEMRGVVGRITETTLKLAFADTDTTNSAKKKSGKSSYYGMGYDVGKGYADGVSDNIPGDEWKPKKNVGDDNSPNLGNGRWN